MHAKHADNRELNELSERVIGCASTVFNTLRRCAAGLSAVQQYGAKVHYSDILEASILSTC